MFKMGSWYCSRDLQKEIYFKSNSCFKSLRHTYCKRTQTLCFLISTIPRQYGGALALNVDLPTQHLFWTCFRKFKWQGKLWRNILLSIFATHQEQERKSEEHTFPIIWSLISESNMSLSLSANAKVNLTGIKTLSQCLVLRSLLS